jgi:cysteinyl-tRNA synthetase
MLHLWNTLHRKLEVFTPLKEGEVGLYTCGPTVYDRIHIGNLRAFTFEDVLQRALLMEGYHVTRVMNITDVGHLVSDADDGEDKMQKRALKVGRSAWDIARECEAFFREDIQALNILTPEFLPRATDHIQEQIELVQVLEKKGFTYRTQDGIYFDTAKLPSYGKLSGQKLEEKEAGARVEVNQEKRQGTDFALWKFSPQGEKRDMEWESPWGIGFPGWHLECSAMAAKYLGQPFDIHCGGVDHIAVHHENEIAQSEAAFDMPLAHYWLHNEFITVDGQKMSKSLGNGYSLKDIRERGLDPIAFRYFCLGAHYRSKLNFTWEALQGAQTALQRLKAKVVSLRSSLGEGVPIQKADEQTLVEVREAMEEDLNTSKVLAIVHDVMQNERLDAGVAYATLLKIDEILGLGMSDWKFEVVEIPAAIQELFALRQNARLTKQWAESDRLRDELKAQGWIVEDNAGESSLRKL